jgi:hypothetical protein
MAISSIKKKVDRATTARELMDIVMENRDRFSDAQGNPLPFVQELHDYVSMRDDTLAEGKPKKQDKPKQGRTAKGKETKPKNQTEHGRDDGGDGEDEKSTRARLEEKFEALAIPMETVEFTRKNYDKLFPGGILDTPLGEVKMGEHQFEKLGAKGREDLLWSLKQTLTDPIVIFSSGNAEIYAKSFKETEKTKGVISVVIKREGKSISVSTHRRDINNITNKIKKGNILYEKNVAKNEDNASAEATPSQASDGGSLKTGGQSPSSKVSPGSGEKSSDFNYKGRDAALKAVKILEEKGDTSRNFKEALAFIGSPEFEKLHDMIDDYMDNVFQNGVNMENPEEKDLVQYVKNYYGAAFGAGGVSKEIADEYGFINDYVVWPTKLREILESHIHWEDGKSAYESADGFAKLVMDIGDAKNLEDIEELSKEAISAMDKEKTKIQKSIESVIRNLRERRERLQHKRNIQKSSGGAGAPEAFDVALDFDGVINSYKSGWKGETETDDQVKGAAEGILKLLETGLNIVIYSTRAGSPEGKKTIYDYLWSIIGGATERIAISAEKPVASVYVDDRAVTFSGDWEEIPEKIEKFKSWVDKSLTWSGHKLQGRAKIQGMDVSIENKKGSTRSGTDKDGHEWHTHMNYDYGYIRGTVGKDKDHVDAYIGPNPESETVFIVHQNDPTTGAYDEDKVMLGFDTLEEAKSAYLSQYDRPGFLGSIGAMDIETFKEKAFDEKNKGKRIA